MPCSFLRSLLKLSRPALLCCALSAPTYAADVPFEVRSAYVEPVENIYLLKAQFSFSLPEGARQVVREGVQLALDVDLSLHRAGRFWVDDSVASLRQQYEL